METLILAGRVSARLAVPALLCAGVAVGQKAPASTGGEGTGNHLDPTVDVSTDIVWHPKLDAVAKFGRSLARDRRAVTAGIR
jgi:hypothetical protein